MTGGVFPPKAKAAVLVPATATCDLAVFKSPTSVQLEPSHASTFAIGGLLSAPSPPTAKAEVLLAPAPPA